MFAAASAYQIVKRKNPDGSPPSPRGTQPAWISFEIRQFLSHGFFLQPLIHENHVHQLLLVPKQLLISKLQSFHTHPYKTTGLYTVASCTLHDRFSLQIAQSAPSPGTTCIPKHTPGSTSRAVSCGSKNTKKKEPLEKNTSTDHRCYLCRLLKRRNKKQDQQESMKTVVPRTHASSASML